MVTDSRIYSLFKSYICVHTYILYVAIAGCTSSHMQIKYFRTYVKVGFQPKYSVLKLKQLLNKSVKVHEINLQLVIIIFD